MSAKARFFFVSLTSAILILTIGPTTLCAVTGRDSAPPNPQTVFDKMRQGFRADKAAGVHARYQWELSGSNGGEWWAEVHDGTFKMGRGRLNNPNVIFRTSDKDWVALSRGSLNGVWAYLTGRLKIVGDKHLARKLGEIFP